MSELLEFLRARLDDDERAAEGAGPDERWNTAIVAAWHQDSATAQHVARWNPVRGLAEVDAKRRIITLCEEWIEIGEIPPNATWSDEAAGAVVARHVLCLMALPYGAHPNYNPAWSDNP